MGELIPYLRCATTFIAFKWVAKAHAALISTRFMERLITLAFSTSVRRPRILRGVSSRQHGVTLVAGRRRQKSRDCGEIATLCCLKALHKKGLACDSRRKHKAWGASPRLTCQ